jgi:hypothetical protein
VRAEDFLNTQTRHAGTARPCGTKPPSVHCPGFCRPCLRSLGRFDPVRTPSGAHKDYDLWPKRRLVVASLIGTLNQLNCRPTCTPSRAPASRRKPSIVSFTADLPFPVLFQRPRYTAYARPYFCFDVQGQWVFRLAACCILFPRRAHPPKTQPNLGGAKDLSVSRSDRSHHGGTGNPCCLSRSWRESSRRVRGHAWQVDSPASSPGADIAGPGNWPLELSNAPAALRKANSAANEQPSVVRLLCPGPGTALSKVILKPRWLEISVAACTQAPYGSMHALKPVTYSMR